jgi:hypothetical protein
VLLPKFTSTNQKESLRRDSDANTNSQVGLTVKGVHPDFPFLKSHSSLSLIPPHFTDGINENPLAFLDDDLDATLKLEDEKRRREQQRLADELMLNDRQKQKEKAAKDKSKHK